MRGKKKKNEAPAPTPSPLIQEAINKIAMIEACGIMVLSGFISDHDLEIVEEWLIAKSRLAKHMEQRKKRKEKNKEK